MSKNSWKHRTRTRKPAAPPADSIAPAEVPAAPAGPAGVPPPLAPIAGAIPPTDDPAAGFGAPPAAFVDEAKMQSGTGKAYASMLSGVVKLANGMLDKKGAGFLIEMEPIEPDEAEFLGTFAYPVLKMYLPNLQQNPIATLGVMTGLMMSGKISFKKREVLNVNAEPRPNDAATAAN